MEGSEDDIFNMEAGTDAVEEKPKTRPKKIPVMCANAQNASFTDEDGRRVLPGQIVKVSRTFADTLVARGLVKYV